MRQKLLHTIYFVLLILLLGFSSQTFALAPMESLILGNFSSTYSENENDPLNYVFSKDTNAKVTSQSLKREMATYRGFYEEGKNLINYCKEPREIRYNTSWEKIQIERTVMAELQYIALDLMSRSIPKYAKALEFTDEEFKNLTENLVGNYCSANLTVISKKELKNNLLIKFEKESSYTLPTVEGNSLFSDNLIKQLSPKIATEQEFKFTIKLFKSICSWNGDPKNPGLLVPMLRHPALMAFLIRQLDNKSIEWKELNNTVLIKEDKSTVQILCDNLICRKTFRENFYNQIYYSIGGTNLSEDLNRLYCENFRTIDYKTQEVDPKIKKMINAQSFDDENLVTSQLIALITGIPDFILRGETFDKGLETLLSSTDYTWTKWAKKQSENFSKDMYFEEPLLLELQEREIYFDKFNPELKIGFDVNLGEFDRINQSIGKMRVRFNLNISRKFLNYYREALKQVDPTKKEEKLRLLNRFKLQLSPDIENAKEKFLIPPWKGDLALLMAQELTEQVLILNDREKAIPEEGTQVIPVDLSYGIFALKYINHQFNVQENIRKNKELTK